ncbi:MAG: tetratricopeptide repeat protein [Candidatus Electrothrix sp. GW3-4]|uniref:tetratricopeptide repeat protein n=1 Tax=Candidatus Electrothrix sp. GW3-4 TaxID=3126740 RepID=UPI0030CE233A
MSNSRNEHDDKNADVRRTHGELSRMMKQGRSFSGLERNCAFLNTGSSPAANNRFATISALSGIDFPDDGRALVTTDWDQDGDLDVWISARNAPRVRFLRNESRSDNNSVSIRLVGNGKETSRDAIGARVELIITDYTDQEEKEKSIQTLRAGEGFLSQDSKWLHFGVGSSMEIAKVRVQWPGGGEEVFTGIEAGNRYTLIQGSGIATLRVQRNTADTVDLIASTPVPRAASQQARIPLLTKLPKTRIRYLDFEGNRQEFNAGMGRPVLITLWAGWCPTCKRELTEFTEHQQHLQEAGIDILTLNVDGLGDERADVKGALSLLTELQFPFKTGSATEQLIKELQELHDLIIPMKRPLPVPTSFLIDAGGRVSVIYKGMAHVNDIIKDAQQGVLSSAERLRYASPLPGRALDHPVLERVAHENQAKGLFYYGTLLMDRKLPEEAALYFQDVLKLRPKSYKAHYNLSVAFMMMNNTHAALFHAQQALVSYPAFSNAHKMLGKIFLRMGEPIKAEEHYLQYLKEDPRDATVLTALGVIVANQGQSNKAEQYFSQAISIEPALKEARYNLGALLLAQGKIEDAEPVFRTLLAVSPQYKDLNYSLGLINEYRKDFAAAATYYMQELKAFPRSPKALVAMGRIMEQEGNDLQAGKFYSQAISIHPDFAPALEGQVRLRQRRGK